MISGFLGLVGLMGLVGLDGLLGAVRLVGLVVVVSYIRFNCKRKNGVKMDGKKFQGVRCQMAKDMINLQSTFFLDPFHKSQVLNQNKDTVIDFTNLTLIGCKCIGFLI